MDQELQKLYSPSVWNKRLTPTEVVNAHGEFLEKNSHSARQKLKSYVYSFSDSDPEQSIEIMYQDDGDFESDGARLNFKGHKIFVYLHGGYWQWGSVKHSSFMSNNFCRNKIITVAVGYTIAPSVTMTQLVEQVERVMAKILQDSGDSDVYVCGHSAGGHLAAMLLNTNFEQKYNVSSKNLKGLIPVSGIFDLKPLIKTDVNDNLKMDEQEARRLSPLLRDDIFLNRTTKFLLAYAENDSPAFHKQSEDFKVYLNQKGFENVMCSKIDECDHFNIIENISQDNFKLTKDIFEFMSI